MCVEDYVLPGVTVLLKLFKDFVQLFLVAIGKLKYVEDLNGVFSCKAAQYCNIDCIVFLFASRGSYVDIKLLPKSPPISDPCLTSDTMSRERVEKGLTREQF